MGIIKRLLLEKSLSPVEDLQLEQEIKKLLSTHLSPQEFKQITGIEPRKFFRYWRTLRDILYNSDGSLTKYAITAGLKDYNDLYEHLKKIKNEGFRKDHIQIGLGALTKMADVVIPKLKARGVIPANDTVQFSISAQSFFYNTMGEIIDDLRLLKKMFRIIERIRQLKQQEELSKTGYKYYNA